MQRRKMKDKTGIILTATVLAVFLFGKMNYAQFKLDPQLVAIKLYKNLDKTHRNSQLLIAIEVKIDAGWHINSDAPNDEFLVPATVDLTSEENFELSLVRFPDPILLRLSFSEEPVSVFEGKFVIGAIIEIPDGIDLGEHKISVEFNYQACDDQTCQPPQTIEAELTIPVVDDLSPLNEINKEIFAELTLTKKQL